MLTWWVRWIVIVMVGLAASIYAMDTVRVASTLPLPPPPEARESQVKHKKPANAIAKASRMDKIADALEGN